MAFVDPLLPARLRRLAFVARNEKVVAGGWFQAAQRLLDFIRPTVMQPYDSSAGTLPPDASHAFGTATQSLWDSQVDQHVMPAIRNTMQTPWDSTMAAAPATVRRPFEADPIITDYLRDSRNRLTNFPNEVYASVQRTIARGLDLGQSIPDVAERIQEILSTTGTDTYRNRAVTVARTETIGAANAGAYASAQALAEVTGDANPQKVWLATDDSRTRETHRAADGQRTALTRPFTVGGFSLQFPGDPTGPPQEVIRCRCTTLHVVGGETLDWTDRQFRQDANDLWAGYDLQQNLENGNG